MVGVCSVKPHGPFQVTRPGLDRCWNSAARPTLPFHISIISSFGILRATSAPCRSTAFVLADETSKVDVRVSDVKFCYVQDESQLLKNWLASAINDTDSVFS